MSKYVVTWTGGRPGEERVFCFEGAYVRVVYGQPQELKAGLATALGRKVSVKRHETAKEKLNGQ